MTHFITHFIIYGLNKEPELVYENITGLWNVLLYIIFKPSHSNQNIEESSKILRSTRRNKNFETQNNFVRGKQYLSFLTHKKSQDDITDLK